MSVSRSSSAVAAIVAALLLALPGCSEQDACLLVDTECQPLYEPTFDNIFQNTLVPSCGVAGVACHASEGARGGLVFADIDDAYQALTDGRRIDPDNIGCGELLSRLGSDQASYQMPPSAPLPEAELCAIRHWVVAGAPR